MMLLIITFLVSNLWASKTNQCASFKIGKRRQLQDKKIAEFGLDDGIRTIHHCQEMLYLFLSLASMDLPMLVTYVGDKMRWCQDSNILAVVNIKSPTSLSPFEMLQTWVIASISLNVPWSQNVLGLIFKNLDQNVLFMKLPIMLRKVGAETSSESNSNRKRMCHCKC